MVSLASSILIGLVGTMFGGMATWYIGVRQRQLENTLQMHREWNALDMVRARHCAADLLDKHPGKTFNDLRRIVGRVGMQDVWLVQNFFARLWLMIQHRQIRAKMVPELFGDRLTWWTETYYEERLFPLKTEPGHHIEQLWQWLGRKSTDAQRARWSETEPRATSFAIGELEQS